MGEQIAKFRRNPVPSFIKSSYTLLGMFRLWRRRHNFSPKRRQLPTQWHSTVFRENFNRL